MGTWARYCPGSTAVPLAVPFFCCLCTQDRTQSSYIKVKLTCVQACRAFPEVLMVQRAGLRLEWEGLNGRTPRVPTSPIFWFFFQTKFFAGFVFFSSPSISPFLSPSLHFVLHSSHLTPPTPNFGGVFPMSPPTLLHHPCPHFPHQPNPKSPPHL